VVTRRLPTTTNVCLDPADDLKARPSLVMLREREGYITEFVTPPSAVFKDSMRNNRI
jgi:hypothetical protein